VDIRHNLYFWVKSIAEDHGGEQYLRGLTFDDTDTGVGSRDLTILEAPLRVVSNLGESPLEGHVDLVHGSQIGYVLRLTGKHPNQMPCMVTSHKGCRHIFGGRVKVNSEDETLDLQTAIGDGMPLVGADWLGIVSLSSEGFHLEAFSNSQWVETTSHVAYCPWWFDSLESADGKRLTIKPVFER
jgi:hypothetical protein